MPNDDTLLMMILSSVVALNQANQTGNYSVLRDLAAPSFQKVNSDERLAQIFAELRDRKLDLTPVLLYQPKLFRKPEINAQGMLRITGFFPTAPERVNFDLIFQPVQSRWRLFGISVKTIRPQQAQPQGGQGARPPSAPESQAAKAPPAPKPKPKPKQTTPEPQASSGDVDVRDRIEAPPATPPAPEKPKQKSIWNPFGR